MAFLTAAEMNTHLYGEVVTEISRGDATLMDAAIEAAIEEARSFLIPRYDDAAIFNATGTARNPIILLYVKDMAVWHFIPLANPNISMELAKMRYDGAMKNLLLIQAGKSNPILPVPATDSKGNNPETGVEFNSNRKRNRACNY